MGYTHYWDKVGEWTEHKFAEFKADARAIFEASDVPTIEESPMSGSLVFNGIAPDDYETFCINQEQSFEFCKTVYKPYDEVVTAVLICAKHHFGDTIEINSDGNWGQWIDGRILYQRTFPDQSFSSPLEKRGT